MTQAGWSIRSLLTEIESGRTTCAKVTREALERAQDASGEGANTFRRLWPKHARKAAEAHDMLRAAGSGLSAIAGLPISIKDNLDVAGEPTIGACRLLEDATPADKDAAVVRQLKHAGAVLVGRTNMSELAFSGVGYNRSFGTPANPFDRSVRRIPGGSSSGGAVSVADRMAVAAIGTDTGGSVRIPAALCGIVGFKPTQARVSRDGVLPLSPTLDCVGWMAPCVDDCVVLDDVLASNESATGAFRLANLRVALVDAYMLGDCEPGVLDAFERAIRRLRDAGASFAQLPEGVFSEGLSINARGGFSSAEAWERFGPLLRKHPDQIDSRIAERIERGASMSAADFVANLRARDQFIRTVDAALGDFDLLMAPTVPICAPPISAMEDDKAFRRTNALLLRNTNLANLMNRPSISIPLPPTNEGHVGLMLVGHSMRDRDMLSWAKAIEESLRPR